MIFDNSGSPTELIAEGYPGGEIEISNPTKPDNLKSPFLNLFLIHFFLRASHKYKQVMRIHFTGDHSYLQFGPTQHGIGIAYNF